MSAFVVVNLSAVIAVNLPDGFRQTLQRAPGLARCDWLLRRYAHAVGLDNRWQMFGRQSRFNWWYVINGTYGEGSQSVTVRIPIPQQTARTAWQRHVTDFREAKVALNLYNNPDARRAYLLYLARQFPSHHGLPLKSLDWQLAYQQILPPEEAQKRQRLCDSSVSWISFDHWDAEPAKGVLEPASQLAGKSRP